MKIFTSINKLRQEINILKKTGKTIGFVPTMGDLHHGHLSLIKKCRKETDCVITSIFVNPTQFGPKEDFKSYPRNKKRDCKLAEMVGCDIVFYPSVQAMYPKGASTNIHVSGASDGLCGAKRPGHFDGVATIVTKLFNIVQPDNAYFGQKDFQQIAVIKKIVSDLNIPVNIKTIPTFREKDGLAMSSRNRYLSAKQRKESSALYTSLCTAKRQIFDGERSALKIKSLIQQRIKTTSGKIDYIECVDAKTLQPVKKFRGKCAIAVAVFFGKARLIDNILLQI